MKLFVICGIGFILGWNLFLIQRDQKMYDAYGVSTYSEVRE